MTEQDGRLPNKKPDTKNSCCIIKYKTIFTSNTGFGSLSRNRTGSAFEISVVGVKDLFLMSVAPSVLIVSLVRLETSTGSLTKGKVMICDVTTAFAGASREETEVGWLSSKILSFSIDFVAGTSTCAHANKNDLRLNRFRFNVRLCKTTRLSKNK